MTMRKMCVELELIENMWKAILNAFECGASLESDTYAHQEQSMCSQRVSFGSSPNT